MAKRLEGRVAIVTGGNSGIGEATAHLFAREGAKVALMARREAKGQAVQDAIRSEGGEAKFIAAMYRTARRSTRRWRRLSPPMAVSTPSLTTLEAAADKTSRTKMMRTGTGSSGSISPGLSTCPQS